MQTRHLQVGSPATLTSKVPPATFTAHTDSPSPTRGALVPVVGPGGPPVGTACPLRGARCVRRPEVTLVVALVWPAGFLARSEPRATGPPPGEYLRLAARGWWLRPAPPGTVGHLAWWCGDVPCAWWAEGYPGEQPGQHLAERKHRATSWPSSVCRFGQPEDHQKVTVGNIRRRSRTPTTGNPLNRTPEDAGRKATPQPTSA